MSNNPEVVDVNVDPVGHVNPNVYVLSLALPVPTFLPAPHLPCALDLQLTCLTAHL